MQTIAQLEANALSQPNSIEVNQALAEAYALQGRWEEATEIYQALAVLYPSTASLFTNRIRLGAVALMISSVLIFIADMIQPILSIGNLTSIKSLTAFAGATISPAYLAAQLLFIIAFALYSCSAISIYKLLSYTRDHRPAFWGMVLNVIGIGLSMPLLGINTFVLPLIGRLYLEGETSVLSLYFAMQQNAWQVILHSGNYLVVAGIAIYSWVVWRNRNLSQGELLIYLAGWVGFTLSNNQLSKWSLILIGIMIALGGLGFGRSLWIQASVQFDAGMDRSSHV